MPGINLSTAFWSVYGAISLFYFDGLAMANQRADSATNPIANAASKKSQPAAANTLHSIDDARRRGKAILVGSVGNLIE